MKNLIFVTLFLVVFGAVSEAKDLRLGTNRLGYTFAGYPDTPVTQATYEAAVASGKLTNWKDSNGNPIAAPAWAVIDAKITAAEAQEVIDKAAKDARATQVNAMPNGPVMNALEMDAAIKLIIQIMQDKGDL